MGGVVKLVNTADFKSAASAACGFESHRPYKEGSVVARRGLPPFQATAIESAKSNPLK